MVYVFVLMSTNKLKFSINSVNNLKIIDDTAIHGGMRLFTDGAKVLFSDGNKLYSMKMIR